MPEPATLPAADVVRALLDGVPRLFLGDDAQLERLVALYAESTWVVHPMSSDIPPLRTRDELRQHFARARAQLDDVDSWTVEDLTLHETTDPEVVVAEFRYAIVRGGEPSEVPCVFVTRVRDGLVVESRDYARR